MPRHLVCKHGHEDLRATGEHAFVDLELLLLLLLPLLPGARHKVGGSGHDCDVPLGGRLHVEVLSQGEVPLRPHLRPRGGSQVLARDLHGPGNGEGAVGKKQFPEKSRASKYDKKKKRTSRMETGESTNLAPKLNPHHIWPNFLSDDFFSPLSLPTYLLVLPPTRIFSLDWGIPTDIRGRRRTPWCGVPSSSTPSLCCPG